jgi:ABC-type uncharacterized transport system involved in gliding motility auxiliary subunit
MNLLKSISKTTWLLLAVLLTAITIPVVKILFPEQIAPLVVAGLLFAGALAALLYDNRTSLRGRSAAFGINSLITTLLVVCLVGVANFFAFRLQWKADLTRTKKHGLAEQTQKLVRELKEPVTATLYASQARGTEARELLEKMQGLSTQLTVELIEPALEPMRARQAGVRRDNTLILSRGEKTEKVEDPDEAKFAGAMIKLVKDKPLTVCSTTGHGERNFNSTEADGFEQVKRVMAAQNYTIQDIALAQEQKVPAQCDVVLVMGPQKAFLATEAKAIEEWLANGGRAVFAIDPPLRGTEDALEINAVLAKWHIKPTPALIIDLMARAAVGDPSMPIVTTYSKDNPITKEMQGQTLFPFARPIDIIPGAPAGMNVQWIARTSEASWGEMSMEDLAKGQVGMNRGIDQPGPLNVAVAAEGKLADSKAEKKTRIVVYGSSLFASNNYGRLGPNYDFLVNAVNWTLEDEGLISIRAKEDEPAKLSLTGVQLNLIQLMAIAVLPLLIASSGIGIWLYRRRL